MRGFTLLELLVAMTVATILLTVGIPSFFRMIAENQRLTNSAELFSSLTFARSEAIARNNEVVVCPSSDETQCDPNAPWHGGWVIYANLDRDTGGTEPDANEPLLKARGPLEGNFTLVSDDLPDHVVFRPSGRPEATGSFRLCPERGDIAGRTVQLTSTGRPRTATHDCGGGA